MSSSLRGNSLTATQLKLKLEWERMVLGFPQGGASTNVQKETSFQCLLWSKKRKEEKCKTTRLYQTVRIPLAGRLSCPPKFKVWPLFKSVGCRELKRPSVFNREYFRNRSAGVNWSLPPFLHPSTPQPSVAPPATPSLLSPPAQPPATTPGPLHSHTRHPSPGPSSMLWDQLPSQSLPYPHKKLLSETQNI